jgi:protein SCO1/2
MNALYPPLTPASGKAAHPIRARLWILALAVLGTILLAGCNHRFSGLVFDDPMPVAEIAGTNYDGQPFHLSDQAGSMTLIFFGYTYCPDICPIVLADMVGARRIIERDNPRLAQDLNLLFVTVDPQRDDLSRMQEYLTIFDPNIYGVLLPDADLDRVKSAYGIYGEIDEPPDGTAHNPESYTITHTGSMFLMDRQNQLKAIFRSDIATTELAADLTVLLRR